MDSMCRLLYRWVKYNHNTLCPGRTAVLEAQTVSFVITFEPTMTEDSLL
jgi:hypothetical protein